MHTQLINWQVPEIRQYRRSGMITNLTAVQVPQAPQFWCQWSTAEGKETQKLSLLLASSALPDGNDLTSSQNHKHLS